MLWEYLAYSITKVMVQNYESLILIAQPPVTALSYEAEKKTYTRNSFHKALEKKQKLQY